MTVRRERMNRVNILLGLAPAVSAPMPMAYVAPVMVTPVDTSAVDAKQFEVRRGAIKPKKEPEVYQPMNAMSQPMNAMSQPMNTTPQPLNATPQPLNTKSQLVNTTPQTAPQNDPQEVLNTLEDVMAELGTVEPEDIEGMEPEEQKQYLMEFITPITAAVEQDDFHVICDELMKEDPAFLVKAVNSPQDMYEAIQKAKTVLKK